MVWTVGLALLADTVNEQDLGKTLGLITLALSMGTLLSPLLGGIVYEKGSYYDVFAIAFGLLALDIMLRFVMIEKKIARKYEMGRDGPIHSTPRISRDAHELAEVIERDRNRVDTDVELDRQARSGPSDSRLPPVIFLLRSRRLLVLPLFTVETFRWSSSGSGLIFLPVTLPALLGPIISRLTDRYGPRYIAATGFLLDLPLYVLLRLVTHKSISQEVLLCALLSLIGFDLALVSTPMFTEIILIVYAKERQRPGIFGRTGATAQAYGLFNVAFAAGTITGPLWAGYVKLDAGWGTMSWSLGLLSVAASVPVLLLTGGWIGKRCKARAVERASDLRV
ncbi:MAG: hypothetical protein M1818_008291 [Claussenomyces sp. TS43310]|nr:MAG: hypothetical protein M1818_008291 [Claussenomyces sp. TS43310]